MNQSDMNEIGKRVVELLNHSKDIGILEKDLTSLVDEYSEIFPKVGESRHTPGNYLSCTTMIWYAYHSSEILH